MFLYSSILPFVWGFSTSSSPQLKLTISPFAHLSVHQLAVLSCTASFCLSGWCRKWSHDTYKSWNGTSSDFMRLASHQWRWDVDCSCIARQSIQGSSAHERQLFTTHVVQPGKGMTRVRLWYDWDKPDSCSLSDTVSLGHQERRAPTTLES